MYIACMSEIDYMMTKKHCIAQAQSGSCRRCRVNTEKSFDPFANPVDCTTRVADRRLIFIAKYNFYRLK